MRTLSVIAATVLILVVAGATIAASPSAAPSAGASATPHAPASVAPSASPKPSASPSALPKPSTSPAPTKAGSAPTEWSAAIAPIDVATGSATVTEAANGTGTLVVHLVGLRPDLPWMVDVDAGTAARSIETPAGEIAFRSGIDVTRVSSDTLRIRLTKTEMTDFAKDRSTTGVVVLVSDGTQLSAAEFRAA